jgi:hypothetical protein
MMCLCLLMLPELYRQASVRSQSDAVPQFKSDSGPQFYDIRLGATEEAKSAIERIDQQIVEQRQHDSSGQILSRRAGERVGRIVGQRSESEILEDLHRAQSRAARRLQGLMVTRNDLTGAPETVESRAGVWGYLTPPSTRKPESIVRAFVSQNAALYGLTRNEANQLSTDAVYTNPAGNLSWVVLSQHIDGIPVFQGEMVAALCPNGEIVRTVGNLASGFEIEGKTAQRSFARKSSVTQAHRPSSMMQQRQPSAQVSPPLLPHSDPTLRFQLSTVDSRWEPGN